MRLVLKTLMSVLKENVSEAIVPIYLETTLAPVHQTTQVSPRKIITSKASEHRFF